MTAALIEIADAVVEALADLDLSHEFQPLRSYADWDWELKDNTEELHVDVVPFGQIVSELASRSQLRYTCTVNVLLRKMIGQDERTEDATGRIENSVVDELLNNLFIIDNFFAPSGYANKDGRLATLTNATWQADSGIRETWSPMMLKKGQYSGWIGLVYSINKTTIAA
jgi:hypothetical protein